MTDPTERAMREIDNHITREDPSIAEDEWFEGFVLDFDKMHDVAIENAFDHGGPDFTHSVIMGMRTYIDNMWPAPNPVEEKGMVQIRAFIENMEAIGRRLFDWEGITNGREAERKQQEGTKL
jgi:hypothetical protein